MTQSIITSEAPLVPMIELKSGSILPELVDFLIFVSSLFCHIDVSVQVFSIALLDVAFVCIACVVLVITFLAEKVM
jgi:hypothetical protein